MPKPECGPDTVTVDVKTDTWSCTCGASGPLNPKN